MALSDKARHLLKVATGSFAVADEVADAVDASTSALSSLSAAELGYIDGVTAGTVTASKAVVVDANKDVGTIRHLTINGNLVSGSTTIAEAELGYLDGQTIGTVTASKAVVVDANKDIGDFRNLDAVNIDAGASGTAGTVDIFPTTASKGKIAISATANTNDDTLSITNAAQAAARTYTIPDALASAQFLLGMQGAVARTASADGTGTGTIADAGLLQFITVTSSDANNIIVLPTPTPGTIILLRNGGTGYELRTSAPDTISINGGAGAAAESAIAANTLVMAVCGTATAWHAWSIVATTLAAVEAAA
jgi:hypothetical protein